VVLALYVPPLAAILKLVPLSSTEWTVAVIVAGVCTLWAEPLKLVRRGSRPPVAR
jgi:hypothetical protein